MMRKSLRFTAAALAIIVAVGIWIPSSFAQNRVFQVFSPDDSDGAFLGIRMKDVTEENRAEYKLDRVQGVIVETVVAGSPAESADLEEKDVVLEFDGLKVRSMAQFSRLVKETPVGRDVELVISRDGKRINITVRLGDRNEQRAESRSITIPAPFGESGRGGLFYRIPENAPLFEPWSDYRDTPKLGISVQAITDQLASYLGVSGKGGVLVTSVMDGYPGAGKLQAGDVIIRADGKAVGDPANLTRILQTASGETLSLDVVRDKKEIKVVVNLPGDKGKEGSTGKEYKL